MSTGNVGYWFLFCSEQKVLVAVQTIIYPKLSSWPVPPQYFKRFFTVAEKRVHQELLITTCKKCDQHSKGIYNRSPFIFLFKSSLQSSRSGWHHAMLGSTAWLRPGRLRRRLVQESHLADIPTYSEKLLLYEQGTLLPYLVEFQFCDHFPCNR